MPFLCLFQQAKIFPKHTSDFSHFFALGGGLAYLMFKFASVLLFSFWEGAYPPRPKPPWLLFAGSHTGASLHGTGHRSPVPPCSVGIHVLDQGLSMGRQI